ncbi:MAG TPA: Wzz/FepE/Etk N-terminal domain-containing protein, partial [Candidatus Polarisedimenticolia bacterium]
MRDRAEQASGLRMALEVFRRRRWLALTAFALCLGGAGGLALFLPDIYRARVTVMVDHQLDAQARPGSIDPESVDTRLQTISQEILSRARLGDLIDRFGLYPEVRSKSSAEALIERMRRDIDLDVKSVGQSWGRDATISFVLGYRGRDPIKVAAVANALASFYVEQNLELRERQATRSAAVLKAQLDEMKSRLDEQEARVAEFKTLHAGELPQQVEANLATLQRLNSQL